MITRPQIVWRVFSQGDTPRLALAEWRRNGDRFFDLRFTVEEAGETAARLTIDGAPRIVFGRAREEADLRDALAAENARGGGGLYDLVERRCRVVWLVECSDPNDRAALRLCAAIASVGLGPILADGELFGVRTAREKLDRLVAPYR